MTAINSNRAIRGPVTAVPVVAGKGVRLVADTENNRWVVEADETVLWEGNLWDGETTTANLSEAASNFEYIRVYGVAHEANVRQVTAMIQGSGENYVSLHSGNVWYTTKVTFGTGSTTLVLNGHNNYWLSGTTLNSGTDGVMIKKLVGCNRIASN